MTTGTLPNLTNLTTDQKLAMIDEIWDSMFVDQNARPVPERLKQELIQSHEDYLRDPSQTVSWEEAKAWILNRDVRVTNPNQGEG